MNAARPHRGPAAAAAADDSKYGDEKNRLSFALLNVFLRFQRSGRQFLTSGRTRYAGNAVPYIAVLAALSVLIAPAPARAQASASPYTSAQRHDAVGRITGMIAPDPDGAGPLHHAAVRNTYDGAGRLTKVETGELAAWQSEAVAPAAWANFTIYRTAETQYDAMSRKVRETLRDGVGGVAGTIRSVRIRRGGGTSS